LLGRLRKKYEEAMAPVGQLLGKLDLTPNMLTILSLLASVLSFWFYYNRNLILGAFCIVLTGIIDMLDGAVARANGKLTRFGAVLDHVLDRYAEYLIIIGIILGNYVDWVWGIFALVGMLMASFTRAKAESVGGLKSCTVGLAERQEKLIIIIVGSFASIYYPNALAYAIILVGILSHITVIQRLEYTWKQTRSR
jgi:archaetidylinositol phosphate synthase